MPIRVLITEDHALVRDGLRRILESELDFEVVGEARDGAEAVRLTASLNPDVVLMDIGMPVLNGVEATRMIKAANPRTAVLALTSYDDDAYVFALFEVGAAGYLLKSAPADQLVTAIRALHSGESILSLSIARKVMPRLQRSDAQGERSEAPLNEREMQVLRLAAGGMANAAIARQLAISARTVQFDLSRIFEKLDVGSRTEAVVLALKRGWLRLEDIS